MICSLIKRIYQVEVTSVSWALVSTFIYAFNLHSAADIRLRGNECLEASLGVILRNQESSAKLKELSVSNN